MQHISLIVAMDKNRVIGHNGRIPWRLPADMARFRTLTMGKPVIMGRKTYESIPDRFRPLPGRHNIVVTRNEAYDAPGATVVHSLAAALTAAGDAPEVMVGGGAAIYDALLPRAKRIYLTIVDGEFDGDTRLSPLDMGVWQKAARARHEADQRHAYAYTFLTLERREER